MKLSILMPVYNEEATLQKAVDRVLAIDFQEGVEVEFIIVNDGSKDRTAEILDALDHPSIRVFHQTPNQGKGAAISRAVKEATGDYVIICDADEEYKPSEIPSLLQPVIDGESQIVYGSRTFGSHTSFSYWYVIGNRGVNFITNVLFNSYISDVETCFKLMPLKLYRSLRIREKGFGMEAEVTAKLLARGYRPYEVPISYKARTRAEGKKITVKDGFEALFILLRIRLREGSKREPSKQTWV